MEYTIEQAEQVIRDWNTFHLGSSDFRQTDHQFLKHKFQQLPEKGWLVRDDKSAIVFRTGSRSGYGINFGKWEVSDYWTFVSKPNDWQPATEEEVITMLTDQAEKMGYVKGVNVKCLSIFNHFKIIKSVFSHGYTGEIINKGDLWGLSTEGLGVCLMRNGKWAEIIADDLQERFDALVKEAKERGKNVTVKFE
jgi:hypothetical protein